MKKKKQQGIEVPKPIIYLAKTLQFISTDWATKFGAAIFTTPIKHKTPKREWHMAEDSKKELVYIPKINKKVVVYHYGDSPKKVLLVHGWSGRGTQLVKFADELLKKGYSTISYDAPAHGKSDTKTTLMPEFIAANLELEKLYGPFDYAIGHSLGGMALLNSVKRGLAVKKLVIIGSGDKIIDILHEFVKKMRLKPIVAEKMKALFEKKFGEPMENYAAHHAAKSVKIPTLVIHDINDYEVPVECGINIHKHLEKGEFFETQKLGHRKILGDDTVINKALHFINE
ncbi:alpha/beta fold hydrolase [Flavobacterium sp. H122]|uniref:alpha/beta fold hydrolase n=1 Tax=Flavobacterium sp. H122 TaxID=2529860 RepID=UPI00145ADE5D|nr:alpha/beta hydrolase [Flavobacterium sp. H122]